VLKTNLAPLIQEFLKILIVIMQMIFATEDRFNQLGISFSSMLQLLDVFETIEAAGNVACRQRIPFIRSDHPNHVHHLTVRASLGFNS
jgi:hypothetical protein